MARTVIKRAASSPSPVAARPVGRPSARTKVLDAALELMLEGGVESLTFDALAERAGVSKGGVLYHFPSREELARAIREYVRERYRAARHEATETLPEGPARALKGW